jgi:methionyl aminopeptidase
MGQADRPRPFGVERKSERELTLMRTAGRIAALTLVEIREKLKPGVTTRQLDRIAERVIAQHKAKPAFKGYPGPYPYPFVTTISINEQLVHGLPGPRVICEGDLVKLDCGVLYQGFYADNAVSVGVGSCSTEAQQLLAVTERALALGIEQALPGGRIGDISAVIQRYVEAQGFHLARDYTGHGIGRHMHEDPEVPNRGREGTGRKLLAGMTLAIEPMVIAGTGETVTLSDEWTTASADGSLTAHFEHTVAVMEGEPEILTTA